MTKREEKIRPSRDRIVIKHKDAGEATVLRSAFEKVWKDRGWSEVKNAEPTSNTTTTAAAKPKES